MAKRKKKAKAWTPFVRGEDISMGIDTVDTKEVWFNSRYQVFVYRYHDPNMPFPMAHLSIKRHDRSHGAHDWREFQRIKNELCGTASEAVELYPDETRNTDMANQYHLWSIPPGARFPLGWDDGRMVSSDPETRKRMEEVTRSTGLPDRSRQRPFAAHHGIEDLPPVGPVWLEWYEEQMNDETRSNEDSEGVHRAD